MADPRFFKKQPALALRQIAEFSGAELVCDNPDAMMEDVAALDAATSSHLSFLDNPKYIEAFSLSAAGACFVRERYKDRAPAGMALLICNDPYRAFALISQRFYPEPVKEPLVHPQACIAADAMLGKNVHIDAGVVIGSKAEIGDGVSIGANCVIGEGVIIGAGTRIGSLCSISHSQIGKGCILHRGIHIGQDGFGFAMGRGGHEKVPQLGRVMIGDAVEIGSGTCIDRGAGPDTIIGDGCKIDNLVQIGHNVKLGRGCIVVSQTGISGSAQLGDGVVAGGQVGIAGHLTIGSGAMLAARTGVTSSLEGNKAYGGTPAVPIKDWHRQVVALNRMIKSRVQEDV